jgi:MFS family permease
MQTATDTAGTGWRGRLHRYGVLRDNPALRALWAARLVSKLGDWSARVALVMLVFAQTHSALWAGVTIAACYVPYLGPGQLLATLADRHPHRTVLIVTDLARLPIFLLLALVPMPPAAMVGLAFVAAFGDVPSTAAFQAAIPMVAKERYSDALVLFGTTAQLTVLVGYAGGGALTAVAGARGVLLLNAATFLLAALLLTRVPLTRSGAQPTRARTHLAQAVRLVASDRLVAVTLAVVAVSCLGQVGIDSLTVVYAHHIGWGTGVGIGLLYVVMPVAAIVTGFFLPSSGDPVRLARLVVGANVALCTLSVVAFLTLGSTPVGLLGIAAQGVLDMMVTPLFLVAEARVPATHRGTVFGFFQTCFMAMQLLGALVAGALTELVGIEAAFALTCLPTVLVGLGTWRLLRPAPAATVQPVEVLPAAAA